MQERFGDDRFLGSSLHLDEKSPHVHVLCSAAVKKERYGKMTTSYSSHDTGNKKDLSKLQKDFLEFNREMFNGQILKGHESTKFRSRKHIKHTDLVKANYFNSQKAVTIARGDLSSVISEYNDAMINDDKQKINQLESELITFYG